MCLFLSFLLSFFFSFFLSLFFLEIKVFIHSPRKERDLVWRDTPALRGRSFDLLLDYHWIKEGGGIAVVLLLGCWGFVT